MATVARQAVELLGNPEVLLLKACGNPECKRAYADRSPASMRRQWCGMDSCGSQLMPPHTDFRAGPKAESPRCLSGAVLHRPILGDRSLRDKSADRVGEQLGLLHMPQMAAVLQNQQA